MENPKFEQLQVGLASWPFGSPRAKWRLALDLPVALQSALLHVVDTGEYEPIGSSKRRRADVRLISATNANLEKEVIEGRFREDLYYRLNGIRLDVPPLRDRPDDILPLAGYFLKRHAMRYRRDIQEMSQLAIDALLGYPWPGNVRELEHTMARAVLMAKGTAVEVDDLGLRQPDGIAPLEKMTLEEVEQIMIEKALARCQRNVQRAAQALGLSRSALYRRMQKFGLQGDIETDQNPELPEISP